MIDIGTRVKTSANYCGLIGTVVGRERDEDDWDTIWYAVQFDEPHEQEGLWNTKVSQSSGEFRESSLTILQE